ncbi:MAG TPA: iron-sulfur cluster assembly scaffold protein [Candidatus Hydrogenedentes bacterium]|jgi:nitrogen fixation NifU-like protein|nr:MAG: NifU-like protein [Candidatus Hydrogenedentes bacterium ADurb.Bin170]HOD95203.1 iron-sulfur cluster assembly scaffold protein [Candidatus Hydrogenedentota bacterium]HOM47176.1 iron-sulfur cluster assembly scaffold protein [Candidatus Hydrogenedentota bacterium]HOR50550.1 iron-sulfur cluster assembly scaffold protein [Candidatus Hydrogenedentota bacterium]HPK24527.1 iron-sulfur cluster assembly scaffold protein [Candidatus Hydrogenedentota bacterium]
MEENYSAKALERFRNPRNYDELQEPDGYARITGPCGDTMEFWVQVDEGIVSAASFTTTGCGPSRACGSMATELAEGRPVAEAKEISQQDILNALGGMPEAHRHCALLASNTLRAALENYQASASVKQMKTEA